MILEEINYIQKIYIKIFGDIIRMCEYCGKTDIYKIEEIRKIIPFIIYQGNEDYDY